MRRREFITLLGSAAVTLPLVARAQQPMMQVIGFLNLASAAQSAERVRAFRQGLSDTGYVEGRNVIIEYRWAEGQYGRLPELAAELVRRRVTLIATTGVATTRAAKNASTNIPIIFYIGGDPIAYGLVASFSRPGGNLTGISNLTVALGPKRLQLLHELVPAATVIGHLVNPSNPFTKKQVVDVQAAARSYGIQIKELYASTDDDFDQAFQSLKRTQAGALVIASDLFFVNQSERLAALSLRYAVPAVSQFRRFAIAGGLASYGANFTESYRQLGVYAGRVLKGERPADLPVQQSTKVELIINLKTAKVLGLTVPLPLLGRADDVIE